MQKQDIASMFGNRGSGPYDKRLKATVLAVGDPEDYVKAGEMKQTLAAVVTDGEKCVRVVVFDKDKFRLFKVS